MFDIHQEGILADSLVLRLPLAQTKRPVTCTQVHLIMPPRIVGLVSLVPRLPMARTYVRQAFGWDRVVLTYCTRKTSPPVAKHGSVGPAIVYNRAHSHY